MRLSTSAVLDRNAEAVGYLRGSMSFEAAACFRDAITQFAAARTTNNDSDDVDMLSEAPLRAGTIRVVPMSIDDTNHIANLGEQSAFAFYEKAFVIEICDSNVEESLHFHLLLTGVLLYNWGLANHYLAIQAGKSMYLHRSLQLYKKAFALLTTQGLLLPLGSMSLLLLALCNNICHCSSLLFDTAATQIFQDNIKCILSDSKNSFQVSDDEFNFFYLTLLLRDKQPMAPFAPAA